MELARRQMQEQYDQKAREHAIKQKEVCVEQILLNLVSLFSLQFFAERRTYASGKVKEPGKVWHKVREKQQNPGSRIK